MLTYRYPGTQDLAKFSGENSIFKKVDPVSPGTRVPGYPGRNSYATCPGTVKRHIIIPGTGIFAAAHGIQFFGTFDLPKFSGENSIFKKVDPVSPGTRCLPGTRVPGYPGRNSYATCPGTVKRHDPYASCVRSWIAILGHKS
eukprot:3353731-Rhodomonas_salina.2